MSDKTQSILIGGAVVAVLSTSYIGFINCLCCAGVIIGAMTAVWHYTNTNSLTIPAGEGAIIGRLAALTGSVLAILINYILMSLGIRSDQVITEFILNRFGDQMPIEQVEAMEDQLDASLTFGSYLLNGLIGLVVSTIFGTIGGAIGASVFKKGEQESSEAAGSL